MSWQKVLSAASEVCIRETQPPVASPKGNETDVQRTGRGGLPSPAPARGAEAQRVTRPEGHQTAAPSLLGVWERRLARSAASGESCFPYLMTL